MVTLDGQHAEQQPAEPDTARPRRWVRAALWLPGLLVAVCAAAATAHGLFEVTRATGTPPIIAGVYPVITDGLALVAYTATARLHDRGRRYAWTVVVLAAGLSGIAQAAYLAGSAVTTPPALRAVIGAWPAIAAAIVAHLLFLIATADRSEHAAECVSSSPPSVAPTAEPLASTVQPSTVQPSSVQSVQPVQPSPSTAVQPHAERSASDALSEPSPKPQCAPDPATTEQPAAPSDVTATPGAASPTRARAERAAREFAARHHTLPTTSQLATEADCSRGTAGAVLKALRERSRPLHVVHDQSHDTDQGEAHQ